MDTIFALATARGRAGVAVVRLSGPCAFAALERLNGNLPEPRRAVLRVLRDGDEILDEALVIRFERGASFTGEDSVELHLHGSPAVVSAMLRVLGEMPGLRMAEPGEFTRRAFENGKIDLAQVEGLGDLLLAETEAQRRQAMRLLSGVLGEKAEVWRGQLIRVAALLEAVIDFAEEDVPEDVAPEVVALIDPVLDGLRAEVAGFGAAERIRDGFEVAIVGPPNIGKSTLLNMLAGREAAITSEIAGTTRDVIEVRMEMRGLAVTLLDTAGLRESSDRVEVIGMARAVDRARAADLRVFLLDGDDTGLPIAPEPGDIVVHGKGDLRDDGLPSVSGLTGAGVAELVERIGEALVVRVASAGTITHERHRRAVAAAIQALGCAREDVLMGTESEELTAEKVRQAIRALESVVGRVDVEDFLSEIFSSFCIGK